MKWWVFLVFFVNYYWMVEFCCDFHVLSSVSDKHSFAGFGRVASLGKLMHVVYSSLINCLLSNT